MCTVPRERAPLNPVNVTGRFLLRPIAPCVLSPPGFPGCLLINGRPYLVRILGELPDEGEPRCRGWQIVKDDGTVYSIDPATPWGQWDCSCPDHCFRPNREGGCRHIAALRLALATPPTPPSAA